MCLIRNTILLCMKCREIKPHLPGRCMCHGHSGVAAGNAHFVGSWVPIDGHLVSGMEGCGPQVRELGLGGAGNHVFRPLCWYCLGAAQPGGRRKSSALAPMALPLYPFA